MGQKISEMTDVGNGAVGTDELELARSSSSTSYRIQLTKLAAFISASLTAIAGTSLAVSGAISGASLALTGAITAASSTLTGALSSATAAISGAATIGGSLLITGVVRIGNAAANTFNAAGLTINQLGANDEIFTAKSTGVTHGMTTIAEANTFYTIKKLDAVSGGASIEGFSSSVVGMRLRGCQTSTDGNKTTGADGAVRIAASIKSGTTLGALGGTANIAVILDHTTTRFIFGADGTASADVAWNTF